MLDTPHDFDFETVDTCRASDVLYQLAGRGLGVDHLSSAKDRMAFNAMLRERGRPLARKIGLPWIETPPDVHDVVSGKTPFGDLYFCDMLASLGPIEGPVLDFGCSSGRVIRNLKVAFPAIDAWGCDPRARSIEFIAPLVPSVNWFVSSTVPPIMSGKLPLFDLVFAISVWSHFSEERALEWFAEMARIIRPGGRLVFSTHGLRSIRHLTTHPKGPMPAAHGERIVARLKAGQFHYQRYPAGSEFDEHWGMAFMPRDWCAARLSGHWTVERFAPGLAMMNQDVYVLRRSR